MFRIKIKILIVFYLIEEYRLRLLCLAKCDTFSTEFLFIFLMQNPANAALRRIKKLSKKRLLNISKILFLGGGFSISVGGFSQEISTSNCNDCQQLNEVQVFGFSPEKFMAGLKVQKIDSVNLARFQFQNLSDFLQFQTPITLKSYGSGQLTTFSFRGTSANHTAVLWNGLNINSPTVGLSDLSTIPLMGFDQMSIQFGSSASCVGSDAVGGSILLSSVPNWNNKGIKVAVGGQYGSFRSGNLNAGLRLMKTSKYGMINSKTIFYGGNMRNFNYQTLANNEVKIDRKGGEYSIEPSETTQKGFVQDLYFRFNTKKQSTYRLIYLNTWFTENKLTIQPRIINFREITQTQAFRFIGGTQLDNTSVKLGFIRDILDYGKGDFLHPSQASTDRYIVRAEQDFIFEKKPINLTVRTGGEFVHYATKVDGYGPDFFYENRGDIYALIRKTFGWGEQPNKIIASLNSRQSFSNRYKAPFSPAFGLNFNLITNKTLQLDVMANVSRSFRLPTLNERYWKILGNPNIQPEDGINKEIGLEYNQLHNKYFKSSFSFNFFHNLIDNWTYWNPEKKYRVENLQQVLSKGLEFSSSFKYHDYLLNKTAGLILAYSLTNASQQKVYDLFAQDLIGKQLIYVPRHAISSSIYFGQKNWTASVQGMFNSVRYYTFDHSGKPFPSYIILNSNFTQKIKYMSKEANLVLQVNNITNTVYPNVKRNAMPGINFQIAIVFSFHQ
jgi:iron complex outermembrane receptor protein